EESYGRYLGLRQEMAKNDPTNETQAAALTKAYANLGAAKLDLGEVPVALGYYRSAVALDADRIKRIPTVDIKAQLAIAYYGLDTAASLLADQKQASEHYQLSLELRKELADKEKGSTRRQWELTESYNVLGEWHLRLGEAEQAREQFSMALQILDHLAGAADRSSSTRRLRGQTYKNLGLVELRAGFPGAALEN